MIGRKKKIMENRYRYNNQKINKFKRMTKISKIWKIQNLMAKHWININYKKIKLLRTWNNNKMIKKMKIEKFKIKKTWSIIVSKMKIKNNTVKRIIIIINNLTCNQRRMRLKIKIFLQKDNKNRRKISSNLDIINRLKIIPIKVLIIKKHNSKK